MRAVKRLLYGNIFRSKNLPVCMMIAFLGGTAFGVQPETPTKDAKDSDSAELLPIDQIKKKRGEIDKRSYKSLHMKNGLDVFLISDPDVRQCAASMNVGVGSMAESKEHLGLAHYLEHVLFMGTEKYPDVGGYHAHIQNNQGFANAYTADENTNYMFQVNEDAFEEALDRFAQFFVAPKFDPKYLEKEKNAVSSEHDKNIKQDNWRSYQLFQTMMIPTHPMSFFSTGNLETLKNTKRKDAVEFYEKYYSANLMDLALICPKTLGELEKFVLNSFKNVPNNKVKRPTFSPQVFAEGDLPKYVYYKPVKDQRKIEYVFTMPAVSKYWKTKPQYILGYLFGREGNGSLLAYFKNQGWATALSSGTNDTTFNSFFSIDIELTPEGERNLDKISDGIFSYINLIKKNGYKKYIYDLKYTMAATEYIFEEASSPTNTVIYYSKNMPEHDAEKIDENLQLLHEYSPEDFNSFLSHLKPEEAMIMVSSADVKTDKKETYYGIEYREEKIKPETVKAWKTAKINPEFAYPEPNPYLPTNVDIISEADKGKPERIFEDKGNEFWYLHDNQFDLPKGTIGVQLYSNLMRESLKNYAIGLVFNKVSYEVLNTWRDQLGTAGQSFRVSIDNDGIWVSSSGYSQYVSQVLYEGISKLQTLAPTENQFRLAKEDMVKDLKNMDFEMSYKLGMSVLGSLNEKYDYSYLDYRDLVKDVSMADVQKFKNQLFSQLAMKGLAVGNFKRADINKTVSELQKKLLGNPLPKKDIPSSQFIMPPKGTTLATLLPTKGNNYAWVSTIAFGKRSIDKQATAEVLGAFWKPMFFKELRDEKQLGYIVHAADRGSGDISGFLYVLQSQKHDAVALKNYAMEWTKARLAEIDKMPDEKFKELKQGVITILSKKDKNLGDKYSRLWTELDMLEGDFDYNKRLIGFLGNYKKSDFIKAVKGYFDEKSKLTTSVFVLPEGAKKPKLGKGYKVIENLHASKEKLPIF